MRIWPVFVLLLTVAGEAQTQRVRPAAKAGTWYTANAKELRREIKGYFVLAPKVTLPGPPVAVVAPHAGYRFSGRCAGAGYATLRGRDIRRVIILAPSHTARFRGGSIADVDCYETPLGKVPLDRTVCDAILKSPLVRSIASVHTREHSLELQLPFLQVALTEFKLVPVVLGELRDEDYAELAGVLREHVDAHTLVVASSDFTHYGRMFRYTPFTKNIRDNIEKLDKGAIEHILKLDAAGFRTYVGKTKATICGRVPIALMLEMLTPDCRGKLVSYTMSGDPERSDEHSVSYAYSVSYASIVLTIGPGEVGAAGQATLLRIARQTLGATLAGKAPPKLDVKDKELQVARGVFVTYKNKGRLRGCIGRFTADEPVWKVVQQMAVASAKHDRRFANNPITAKEEPNLDIQISILSPMIRIKDPLDFIPGVHGLYVKGRDAGGWMRSGTYLPQVATELKADRRAFISHLCRYKVGIAADAWKDKGTEVYIYSAEVFGK